MTGCGPSYRPAGPAPGCGRSPGPRRPKFLLDLTGSGRTLIQATSDRLAPLVGDRVVVVTGAAHEEAVRRQLPQLDRVIAEPSPRDSMAAIGLAAAQLEREDPEALVGSFAADHVITDEAAFADVRARGRRGRRQRTAGDDRDRADPCRHRVRLHPRR